MPALSGIVANTWYDREAGMQVSSVSDPETTLVGGLPGVGSSPRRMLVDTVGDELKIADDSQSRVIGISLKDRAAILPAGHMANAAYWFDSKSRQNSFPALTISQRRRRGSKRRTPRAPPTVTPARPGWATRCRRPASLYSAIEATPYGNEIVEDFAERALAAEATGPARASPTCWR